MDSVKSFHTKPLKRTLQKTLYNLYELKFETPGLYLDEIADVMRELQKHDPERYKGARVSIQYEARLQCQRPTRQALIDEPRHAYSNLISVVLSNGNFVSSTSEVFSAYQSYYTTLFRGASDNHNSNLLKHSTELVTPLSEGDCAALSGPITKQENELAIDELPL